MSYNSKTKHNGNPLTHCDLKEITSVQLTQTDQIVFNNYEGSVHHDYVPQGGTILNTSTEMYP
jgi:hypothetical protein